MSLTEENVIVKSEAIIRNTFNSLINNLKLNENNEHREIKEYFTIHEYLTSLALRDFATFNEISRMVKVKDKITNKTAELMEIVNNTISLQQVEIKSEVTNNDDIVIIYILYFLDILKKLKDAYIVDKAYRNVNREMIKVLQINGNRYNNSKEIYKFDQKDILNENEFWEPSARRIYKGERTKIRHFPFMASIQIFNNFHCAGSIIQSDLIITASSCLQLAWNNRLFRENPAFLSARVGSSFYNGGGEVIPVLEIYFHPDYNPKNLRNNICLLRLVRHLNLKKRSRRVKKIDFDRHPSNLPVNTPGVNILGWGAKQHSPVIGNPWKNKLSLAMLDIYPWKECQDVYSREYVTNKNFCAGFFSRGGGACNRDVGGPGIADGKLIGVISFGSPVCGTPDAPTVFTKLGYYSDWIEDIMEMVVPVSMKITTLKPFFDPFSTPPSYTSQKPTTFKIPPLTGENMTPIPITFIDNQLRIFDENVFKDFLGTMFHSEEVPVKEKQDVKNTEKGIKPDIADKYGTRYYDEITEKYKPITEVASSEDKSKIHKHNAVTLINEENQSDVDDFGEEIEKEEKETEKYKPITEVASSEDKRKIHKHNAVTLINEENQSDVDDFDEEIEKLIKNVNLEKIVKEEVNGTSTFVKVKGDGGDAKTSGSHKAKNESVLTFLYLSDDEKKGDINMLPDDTLDTGTDFFNGIPAQKFEDLTRTKDKLVRVLPESDLLGLLSEVIEQELLNTDNNNS